MTIKLSLIISRNIISPNTENYYRRIAYLSAGKHYNYHYHNYYHDHNHYYYCRLEVNDAIIITITLGKIITDISELFDD